MTTATSQQTSGFRRVAAILTIGSFSIAALMGIIALLGGGEFGDNEIRILLTTIIVGCASICALSYLATAGTPWAPVGVAGGVVLIFPVVTSLVMVWSDWAGASDGVKALGIGIVLSVTAAQLCLLLALAGDGRLGAVLWSTVAVALLVALLVSGMIGDGLGGNDPWRLLGVLGILDVLGTVVTIAMAKFGDRGAPRPGVLRLQPALGERRTAELGRLAAAAGVTPEALVCQAVDRLLDSAPHDRAAGPGPDGGSRMR